MSFMLIFADNLFRDKKKMSEETDEIKRVAPIILSAIIEKEIAAFNELKKSEYENTTWAETVSYRIYTNGFDTDDYFLRDSEYSEFYKRVQTAIENLNFFDGVTIQKYKEILEEENGGCSVDVIDDVFCKVVTPIYPSMPDEKKNSF